MAKGGYREGAGRPKGSENKDTKEKRIAQEQMINRIVKNIQSIINAQLSLAKGTSYVYRIDEIGEGKNKRREHVLVTDKEEIKSALDSLEHGQNGEDGYYYITTKAPDNRAIENLVDRAFGKPKETLEVDNPGQDNQIEKLRDVLKEMIKNVNSKRTTWNL